MESIARLTTCYASYPVRRHLNVSARDRSNVPGQMTGSDSGSWAASEAACAVSVCAISGSEAPTDDPALTAA